MAAPVIYAIFGNALLHALSKPWPWLMTLGFFAISKFDFGIFANEVRATIWSLWPFVILFMILWFALGFYKAFMQLSRKRENK